VGYLPYSFGCEDLEISSDFDRSFRISGEISTFLTCCEDPEISSDFDRFFGISGIGIGIGFFFGIIGIWRRGFSSWIAGEISAFLTRCENLETSSDFDRSFETTGIERLGFFSGCEDPEAPSSFLSEASSEEVGESDVLGSESGSKVSGESK
jgi:hypothetical protein